MILVYHTLDMLDINNRNGLLMTDIVVQATCEVTYN